MLQTLHTKFAEIIFAHGIKSLNFSEGAKTNLPFKMRDFIVPPEYSGKRISK